MSAYHKSSASSFVRMDKDEIVGFLSSRIIQEYSGDYSRQLTSWRVQVEILQGHLKKVIERNLLAVNWGVLFEYPLLRLQRRLDVVFWPV